jgi:hypothetical protein
MKANELRVNNLVIFNGKIFPIQGIEYDSAINAERGKEKTEPYYLIESESNGYLAMLCEPILLTDEWLKRFGFTKDEKYYSKESFDVDLDEWFGFHKMVISCPLKYVHQLQNLYFALTGEELTLK